jgi:hypothetical protein
MKKIFTALMLTAFTSILAFAQTDYKKTEFYIGYSNGQVENGNTTNTGNAVSDFFDNRTSQHGFETAGVYNFSRYVGIKADFSGTYKSDDFSSTFISPTGNATVSGKVRHSLYNALGGVQIKDNSVDKTFKPFAHAMVGIAHSRDAVSNYACAPAANCTLLIAPSDQTFSNTHFAGAFGGGLDIKVSDRFDFRAFQVDYNPIWRQGGVTNNVRFGIGIVIK